jgi:hypothetical protein
MISERYARIFSIYKVFNWILSILIGLVLAITCLVYFPRLANFAASPYITALIGAFFAYIVLTRLIHPAWRTWSSVTRYSVMVTAITLAAIILVLAPPIKSVDSLRWQSSVGPTAGQAATVFSGQSWGSQAQNVIELHASEDPNDPEPKTTFGVWRATSQLDDMLNGLPGQLRFYMTQPDWAVIDPQTGQAYQNGDGVTVIFKTEQAGRWQIIQQIYLNPATQPDYRRWQPVDVDIPANSTQFAIEVRPGGNNWHDRIWITTGTIRALPKEVVQSAQWLSASFLVYLGLLAIVWSLQTRPGKYVETYVQSIMQQYGGVLTALPCLLLGYLLIWQRGMYLDDYSIRFAAFNETGQWRPIFDQSSNFVYPARLLTWEVTPRLAALLLNHEFFVRSLITLFVGLNALLLGWLIYRIIGSRLGGLVGGWLFLMPVFTSTTVWVGASTYIFSVTSALLFLHSFWSGLVHPQRQLLWIGSGVVTLSIMLLFGEAHLSVIIMASLIGGVWIADSLPDFRARLRRVLLMLIWPLLTFGCLYIMVFRNPQVIEARGGITTDPAVLLEKGYGFLHDFFYWTVAPGWGQQTTKAFFSVGIATVNQSWQGRVLTGIAATLMLLTALAWRSEQREYRASYRVGLLAIATGAIWFVTAMTIPLALAQYAIYYESRFAYFPLAGIALLIAALIWSAAKLLRHPVWEKILVGIAGVILLIATISTVGLAEAYAARNSLDRNQIDAVRRAVPVQYLPTDPIFVAVNIDEQLPGDAAALPVFGTGVLEAPWAGCPELREAYQRNDLIILATNRWVPMKFSYMRSTDSASSFDNLVSCQRQSGRAKITFPPPSSVMALHINDTYIPLDKAVLFTYKDGQATVIESLVLQDAAGLQQAVQFPVGKALRHNGIPTIDGYAVTNQPVH